MLRIIRAYLCPILSRTQRYTLLCYYPPTSFFIFLFYIHCSMFCSSLTYAFSFYWKRLALFIALCLSHHLFPHKLTFFPFELGFSTLYTFKRISYFKLVDIIKTRANKSKTIYLNKFSTTLRFYYLCIN